MDPDPDPIAKLDPGFWWPRSEEKKIQLKIFFYQIAIYLSLGLLKGRPSCRRSLKPSEENILHCKRWNLLTVFYFYFHFCPCVSGTGLLIRIRILGPHWIRIQSGSGFTTPNQIGNQTMLYCQKRYLQHGMLRCALYRTVIISKVCTSEGTDTLQIEMHC